MEHKVQDAIDELRAAFPKNKVLLRDDGEGGAYVIVEGLSPGPQYTPTTVWIGFRITFQYPYADVYPHFVDGSLRRNDGRELGEAMAPGQTFEGRPAVQISRKTNRPSVKADTAARKLLRVLAWLRNRT